MKVLIVSPHLEHIAECGKIIEVVHIGNEIYKSEQNKYLQSDFIELCNIESHKITLEKSLNRIKRVLELIEVCEVENNKL